MNVPRMIMDGIMLCLAFNLTVALLWMFVPCAFCNMLPKEIRKASPKRKKKEVIILTSNPNGGFGRSLSKIMNISNKMMYDTERLNEAVNIKTELWKE
ncbi:MAG: hypothetical protein K6G47_01725 [Clostridia bacterium]|nr:hypothetical protein [Clostridia bacterium]